ncbi:MAG: RNA polymerase sigma factor [Bacteroidales bacterium]|nr:RNA polymerase sigma factor [Bacteroidales bacterium]
MNNLEEVIQGCVKGKRKSQEMLFNIFSKKMFAVCLYYSKNKDEAEDILHNGFLKIFENIKQYKGRGSFEGWVRKIFVNTALEKFRSQTFLTAVNDQIEYDYMTEDADIISKLSSEELIKMIQELSPAYRMVFNLYAVEGYSHEEISKKLEIAEGTSKSNLARARKILQKKVRNRFTLSEKKMR